MTGKLTGYLDSTLSQRLRLQELHGTQSRLDAIQLCGFLPVADDRESLHVAVSLDRGWL
jgi:hypothetical protein